MLLIAFEQGTMAMIRRLESLTKSAQTLYMRLPAAYCTPNCVKTQHLLANAFASKPTTKLLHLESHFKENQDLQWLSQLQSEGKVVKATKVCRLTSPTAPSPPPMANVQRSPLPFSPRIPEPIIIEDEETPVAEISKGSETEFQVYSVQLKSLEEQIQAVQKKQAVQSLKTSAAKYKLQSVKNELASIMRRMKKLEPLIPRKKSKPQRRMQRKARPVQRFQGQSQRQVQLRQFRLNKNRVMRINQAMDDRRKRRREQRKAFNKRSKQMRHKPESST